MDMYIRENHDRLKGSPVIPFDDLIAIVYNFQAALFMESLT